MDGMPFYIMMQHMPISEDMKLEMLTELLTCYRPIFRDQTVLIFMVLLAVFDEPENKAISSIKDHLLSLLGTYLKDKEYVGCGEMKNIMDCIKTLPRLLNIFLRIRREQSALE